MQQLNAYIIIKKIKLLEIANTSPSKEDHTLTIYWPQIIKHFSYKKYGCVLLDVEKLSG